jgi:hypothetical protein
MSSKANPSTPVARWASQAGIPRCPDGGVGIRKSLQEPRKAGLEIDGHCGCQPRAAPVCGCTGHDKQLRTPIVEDCMITNDAIFDVLIGDIPQQAHAVTMWGPKMGSPQQEVSHYGPNLPSSK